MYVRTVIVRLLNINRQSPSLIFQVIPYRCQKTEHRDILGQVFIVAKTRDVVEKIFRDRFCHGISVDILWPKIF